MQDSGITAVISSDQNGRIKFSFFDENNVPVAYTFPIRYVCNNMLAYEDKPPYVQPITKKHSELQNILDKLEQERK